VAVQFVLNYEEGGENHILHGDPGSEQFLSEMFNPASYPARHMSMDGIYEYGSRAGVWRILKEFEKHDLVGLAFYDSGSRSFYNSKRPINTPADMKGMKIRTPNSDMSVAMINATDLARPA
jgi:hypothetical protein